MDKRAAAERIEKLRDVIEHHRYLYHVLDTQEISDAALDSLKHELFALEQAFPDLITNDSPTQRVGGAPREMFTKYRHGERMLSMEDVFSREEFEGWARRARKAGWSGDARFFCMTKIDGLAISLTYEGGKMTVAATRGDGFVGEEVTENVRTIESVPLRLRQIEDADRDRFVSDFGLSPLVIDRIRAGNFVVRGEVFMRKEDFENLNRRREKDGETLFANPRNVSAGSIRQLDSKVTASRPLRYRAWHLDDIGQGTQGASMAILEMLGFNTAPGAVVDGVEAAEAYFEQLDQDRDGLAYWIDGLVVRVDDLVAYKGLGVVGKTPRGLVAWKFPAEEVTTQLASVDWQVGRTGKLTPVATVKAAEVAGTTVTHATLHNVDEIRRLGVKIGDTVILKKAGDIIPKIVKVLEDLRTGEEVDVEIPDACPVCEGGLESPEGAVDLFCENDVCFSKEKERILHAARAFDVVGLGGKTVERFLEIGLISSPADLFRLTSGDIRDLEGFGDTSAEKLVEEIVKKKSIGFDKYLQALSISNVGEQTARDLAKAFEGVEGLMEASRDRLMTIDDVGPVVADSILAFFGSDRGRRLVADFAEVGVVVEMDSDNQGGIFDGKTFVLTGTMSVSREVIAGMIRERGGKVSSSVSKKTDYLVAGENAGSKKDKAEVAGVEILSEAAFRDML